MTLPNEITDVVWLQTGFIGDIILNSAAIRLLSQEKPEIRQHMITTQAGAEIFAGDKTLFNAVVFHKRKSFFSLKPFMEAKTNIDKIGLKKESTVLLQVHRSVRSSLLSWLLNFTTATYLETPFRIRARWKVPRIAVFHETARIGMLLTTLGISRRKILEARPHLKALSGEIGDSAAQWSTWISETDGEIIAVAPGSVWGTKRWPSGSFAELVQKILTSRAKARIVLIGSPAETGTAQEIVDKNQGCSDRLCNLVGTTSLQDLRRIFPRVKLLIANDSSPIHFASAFSVPTIGLFGATIPEMGFGPTAPGSKVLGVKLRCRPCSDHGPKQCPLGHFQCMKTLSVDSVFKACNDILATQITK